MHNTESNPINFVFHGGSGSSRNEIREAIGYGAVKMNIDTDMQWAFCKGVNDYHKKNQEYLVFSNPPYNKKAFFCRDPIALILSFIAPG